MRIAGKASALLKRATIVCGDYKSVLSEYAKKGDFVFLDPPYVPVSEYADFKRYTKEQFSIQDHIELAGEVDRLCSIGCYSLLTNSNHQLVHELYQAYPIEVLQTKRYISSKSSTRKGEDVIVTAAPAPMGDLQGSQIQLNKQVERYPTTRFMESKRKLLLDIWSVASRFNFDSVADLFSGSGVVGYMFKAQGKKVICNDHMAMSANYAKAMIENSYIVLSKSEAEELLVDTGLSDHFVSEKFQGLYFSDEDNHVIDILRSNILISSVRLSSCPRRIYCIGSPKP